MYEDKINAGISFLRDYPFWINAINLDTFDMQHIHTCVIGQVFHGWIDVLSALEIHSTDEYGFTVDTSDMTIGRSTVEYAILTSEWKKAIIALREGEQYGITL